METSEIDQPNIRETTAQVKDVSIPTLHNDSLDGLRFYAFIAVFIFHAFQNNIHLSRFVKYGSLGVEVFFVLSGFLIGRILLSMRDQSVISLKTRLGIFYGRRALRIFPLYYLALFLIAILPLLGIQSVGGKQFLIWNALYLSNFKIYLSHQMMGGQSHFWSLAVEEHFYLLAPFLILTLSDKNLSRIFIAIWISCAVARGIMFYSHTEFVNILSPMQFDCLTVGIAAAMVSRTQNFLSANPEKLRIIINWITFCIIPVYILNEIKGWGELIHALLGQWMLAIATAGLILNLWNGGSRLQKAFTFKPFVYLGKISYGLYVYHLPVIVIVSVYLSGYLKHGSALPALVITILVAMLSFHLFEKPINNLKKYLPYK